MKIIIIFLLFLIPCKRECLQLDILLIGDLSGSVQGNEDFIKSAFYEFSNQFELSEETIKIGVISFNDQGHLDCHLTSDKKFLISSILSLSFAHGTTNMLSAFQLALDEFNSKGRYGYRKLIIIVSDGIPDREEETKLVINQIKMIGVDIYGIVINMPNRDEQFMEDISSHYLRSDFTHLASEIKKLNICL